MTKLTLTFAVMSAAVLVLTACGGGAQSLPTMSVPEPVPDPTVVPASALASPMALTAYAGQLPADEMAEPLKLDDRPLPSSETDEPEPVKR